MPDHIRRHSDALPAGSILHGCRIVRMLGAGSSGISYLAANCRSGALHTLKEYFPNNGLRTADGRITAKGPAERKSFRQGLKDFFREAELLRRLSHPNIVGISGVFKAHGHACFMMPYLRGITFHQWIKAHPNPNETELSALFAPLLDALGYLHSQKLLHGDLKPENILITENRRPVLIDFGAARRIGSRKHPTAEQAFTPAFAPIEQYLPDGRLLPASDLYGAGACLYQALTRQLPPEAPERTVGRDPHPVLAGSSYQAQYSPAFLAAVDCALSVRAEDRFQSAEAMRQALLGRTAPPYSRYGSDNRAARRFRLTAVLQMLGKPFDKTAA